MRRVVVLPEPLGPDQTEEAPDGDVEVDRLDGVAVPEILAEPRVANAGGRDRFGRAPISGGLTRAQADLGTAMVTPSGRTRPRCNAR